MGFDTQIKLVVYRHFVETGQGPLPGGVAARVGSDVESVLDAFYVAIPLSCSGCKVVGRHRLHLKQHALLPVGRTGSGLVRGA